MYPFSIYFFICKLSNIDFNLSSSLGVYISIKISSSFSSIFTFTFTLHLLVIISIYSYLSFEYIFMIHGINYKIDGSYIAYDTVFLLVKIALTKLYKWLRLLFAFICGTVLRTVLYGVPFLFYII